MVKKKISLTNTNQKHTIVELFFGNHIYFVVFCRSRATLTSENKTSQCSLSRPLFDSKLCVFCCVFQLFCECKYPGPSLCIYYCGVSQVASTHLLRSFNIFCFNRCPIHRACNCWSISVGVSANKIVYFLAVR